MLTHPVTSYWHRANELCLVVPPSSWVPFKEGSLLFVKSLVWLDQAPTGNWTHRTTWSVQSTPYCRLLWSAGVTEGLFVTRELHQEPRPQIPTGYIYSLLVEHGVHMSGSTGTSGWLYPGQHLSVSGHSQRGLPGVLRPTVKGLTGLGSNLM